METHTSGAEGGPEKPTSRKAGRALRSDPYTYVKTHTGWVYVAFIVDVFSRMVVGWQASRSLRADLAIDALEMAVHNRGAAGLEGLVHHSDRGVQGEINWSSQHLTMMEVADGATAADGGQGASAGDEVAGEADSGASC